MNKVLTKRECANCGREEELLPLELCVACEHAVQNHIRQRKYSW